MNDRKCEIMCIKGRFRIPGGDELMVADEHAVRETSIQIREMMEESHHASLGENFLLALLHDVNEFDVEKRQRILDLYRALCNEILKCRAIVTPKQIGDCTRAYLAELALATFNNDQRLTRASRPILFRHRDAIGRLTLDFTADNTSRSAETR